MPEEQIQEAEIIKPRTVSPIPEAKIDKTKEVDFPTAIQAVIDGKKITKKEWNNDKIYGYLSTKNYHLTLHKDDDKDYDWIISGGDLSGIDWIIFS